jgi:23S rRNA (pseudouridine1915-N3)-methyltransferase
MPLKIIAVGKSHESWIAEGVSRYERRLKTPFSAEWVFLPHSSREGLMARQDESERVLARLNPDDFVILLDERGRELDSPQLAALLKERLDRSISIALIIGGAYGVTDELRNRADIVWSLSPLVFPHQLVRLIVVEQLYRSQEISRGAQYHHD